MSFFKDLLGTGEANAGVQQGMKDLKKGYQATAALYQPYREGGAGAFGMQGNYLGLNGQAGQDQALAAFRQSPGYQFQMDEAMRGVEGSAAARGGLMSGGTMRALSDRAQGLADSTAQQWYGNLAGMGATGANTADAQAGRRMTMATGMAQGSNTIGNNNAAAAPIPFMSGIANTASQFMPRGGGQ